VKILKFSRSFWETALAYKGAKPNVLRDYDLLKDRQKGLTCGQLAIKYNISCTRVMEIIKEYQ
jgi:Mor family transcriptional regulator